MIETFIIIYVLLWIIPCMIIASAKKKDIGTAFLASLFFGIFALIYYIFVGEESSKEKQICSKCGVKISSEEKYCSNCGFAKKEAPMKICPHCDEENKLEVKYCTSCGYNFNKKIEFVCNYCNKKFTTENLLKTHTLTCSSKKKYDEEEHISFIIYGSYAGLFILLFILVIIFLNRRMVSLFKIFIPISLIIIAGYILYMEFYLKEKVIKWLKS